MNLEKFNQLPPVKGVKSPVFARKEEVFQNLPQRNLKSAGKIIEKLYEDPQIEIKVVDLENIF